MFKSINIYLQGSIKELAERIETIPELIYLQKGITYITTPEDSFLEHVLSHMQVTDIERRLWSTGLPYRNLIAQFGFVPDYMLIDDQGKFMEEESRKSCFLQMLDDGKIAHYMTARTFDMEAENFGKEAFIRGFSENTGLIWNPKVKSRSS